MGDNTSQVEAAFLEEAKAFCKCLMGGTKNMEGAKFSGNRISAFGDKGLGNDQKA